jgi:hypothetical protein
MRKTVISGRLRKPAMALLLLLAGYESEATNGIVKRFMMAGGGDPKQLADEQIRAWITSHAQVRQALIPLCATKRLRGLGENRRGARVRNSAFAQRHLLHSKWSTDSLT